MSNQKQWWAPLWKGLIIDQDGKHFRRMGNAVWLFLYLLVNANREDGSLKRKIETIINDVGVSKRTLSRWFTILKENGYITTSNTGRHLYIVVKKWKTFQEVPGMAHQKCQMWHHRVAKYGTSESVKNSQISPNPSQKNEPSFSPNDITLKKILNNDNNVNEKIIFLTSNKTLPFKTNLKTKKDLLAYDICKSLNDEKNIALYLSYTRKYPKGIIIQAFNQVKETPQSKIKKSKGALFTYLVKHYGKKQNSN